MCALNVELVVPVKAARYDSPSVAVLPSCDHCAPGAATQRMMPPNRFKPRFKRASVVTFVVVGCVDAAMNDTGAAASAAVDGCAGPSEAVAVASAVGVVSTTLTRPNWNRAGADEPAKPEISTSRMSMSCVLE